MTLAERLGATALRMIERYGSSATFRSNTATAFDPSAGKPSIAATDTTVKVFLSPITTRGEESMEKGMAVAYLAADAVASRPKVNDALIIGATSWTVFDVADHQTQDRTVLYELSLRRA